MSRRSDRAAGRARRASDRRRSCGQRAPHLTRWSPDARRERMTSLWSTAGQRCNRLRVTRRYVHRSSRPQAAQETPLDVSITSALYRRRPAPRPSAAEAAVEAIAGAAGQDVAFSLALSQDQKDIRDWVHGFAADVMRPAAHEWDEKEQTPWPIIQEAAKIGLYGFEGLAQFFADPTGLSAADRQRGAVLGRRRHRHVDHGHRAGRRRDLRPGLAASRSANGSRAASAPPTTSRSPPSAPLSPTPARTSPACARMAKFDEAAGEWVLNGQKAWATNGGISDVHVVIASRRPRARLQRPRGLRRADERGQGHLPGLEGLKARPARLAHRRCVPRRLPHPRRLRARRQGEARRAPRARARGQEEPSRRRRCRPSRPRARPSARRRWGSPAPPTSTRSTTPRSASSSAARSSRTSRSPSRWRG